jgi:hypothetical protein
MKVGVTSIIIVTLRLIMHKAWTTGTKKRMRTEDDDSSEATEVKVARPNSWYITEDPGNVSFNPLQVVALVLSR